MMAILISLDRKEILCPWNDGAQLSSIVGRKRIRIELGLRYRRDLSQLVSFRLGGMVALQSAESP